MAGSAIATTSRSSVNANSASDVIANVQYNREFMASLQVIDSTGSTSRPPAAFT